MKKIVLFDLYDTVLKDISFHFDAGIDYLYKRFFTKACSLEDMMAYADTFLPLYEMRKINNTEICLIKDEIPLYFKKFGIEKPDLLEEVEYEVMNAMQKVTLTDDVRDTLNGLQKQGIHMYILSNSIFTGNAARRLLNDFGILHHFKKVYSSADYGIRKPCPKFYRLAIDEIISDNPDMHKEDILYVGNDYVTDVMGAALAGLDVIWFNVNHLPNNKNILTFDIDDFKTILEIVRK